MAYTRAKDRIGTTVRGFHIKDVKRENRRTYALIICPYCKKEKWMRMEEIVNGKSVSCGCYNKEHNQIKPVDISGRQFERLKAIIPTESRDKHNGSVIWKCECRCGNTVFVSYADLIKGYTKSCGCLGKETSQKNGKIAGNNIRKNFCIDHTNVKNLTMKIRSDSTSGIKGVSWDKSREKWVAQIRFKGKNYHLGRFDKKEDAEEIRKTAEEKIFGSFLTWYEEMYPDRWKNTNKRENN